MVREMRIDSLRRTVFPAAALLALILLVPELVRAQQWEPREEQDADDFRTTVRGPLQERLAQFYPDSFRQGVDIFWEPGDGWVSEEVFSWWRAIVPEEDRAGLTRENATRMFSRFPGQEARVFSAPRKRQLCAVIGPSCNLLGSRYGHLIDAHDVVIRVNRAPTDHFKDDVGDRTTHHLMWPRNLERDQYDPRACLLITPIAFNTLNVFERISELVSSFDWDLERVRIIHPEFVKYVHQNWTGERKQYPSTGFIALMMALHVCDEVDVFGFGADAAGKWDRYYEDDAIDVSEFHPGDYEGFVRHEMESQGILKVFRGSRAELDGDNLTPRQD
jgi:beta-galactoside alpha-2,3-sialyltransferase (sialyltransferase 4A)